MSDIDVLQDRFMKADALAQAGDENARKDAALFAAEIRRLQTDGGRPKQAMRQVNRGIADAVGGLVDFVNPFDEPHSLNPFPEGTGSARGGLTAFMERGGIEVAEGDVDNGWEGLQRGAGEAAGALLPVMKGLSMLRGAGGEVGQFADDAYRSMASVVGTGAEVSAGGVSRAAEKQVEVAGGPEWLQQTAAVAAPIGLSAVRPIFGAVANISPGANAVKHGLKSAKAAVAPYTDSGAYEVARKRMQSLAGGKDRAARLADRIDVDNDYRLTPAQQTEDPNMRGLEKLAAEQDPNLRERLEVRAGGGRNQAAADIDAMGGDVQEARDFFTARRREFKVRLEAEANDALARAGRGSETIANISTESRNSEAVMEEIHKSLTSALSQEKALWDAVPKSVLVDTVQTKAKAGELLENIPYAQRKSIPEPVREVLETPDVYGDTASVNDMHGLYSELRRVARSAMAGNDQNKKMARIANEVADAVLDDLGANGGASSVGRQINDARAFSRELHETFDRGTVGRLLKRTLDGDTSIEPELAMKRSVGRNGAEAAVSARQMSEATDGATDPFVSDYIKERFNKASVSAKGEFNNSSARKFIRDNAELLERYPELRSDIYDAVETHETAEAFAGRISMRIKALEDSRRSATAGFLSGPPDKAFKSILDSKTPSQAARRIASEARKDPSGKALAGVKGAFSSHLISDPTDLARVMDDPKIGAAMRQIYSAGEMARLKVIAREVGRMDAAGDAANIGTSLSGATPNKLVEYMARVVAARHGAELGGSGGGSLQTAQMASSRMKEILGRLVSDKSSQILADAIEDPELFKALLTDVRSKTIDERVLPRLVPYLVGAGSVSAISE